MRRTISELLDQLYAVEHSMEIFNRKGDGAELERAAEHFNDMLGHVDQLGESIGEARAKNRAHKRLPERGRTLAGNSGW